jgi:putative ABC transport system permease protein
MFGGGEVRTEVYVPFSTAVNLNPDGWLNYAVANMRSTEDAEDVKSQVRFVLRRMRNLEPSQEDTFDVEVLQQFIDRFNSVASGITAGAAGIVGISLLVGGIGIMNIMLVSVSERTREIGLRKAVGARPIIILLQFLVEAVVLCLSGGALGLAVGQGLVLAIKNIPGAPLEHAAIPMWAVGLAIGFSAGTGVIFGMFPAIKAARLDPIDALRHE